MAEAYGMYSIQGQGSKDQIYIGWRIEMLSVPWWNIFDPILYETDGVEMFWEQMGLGRGVRDALWHTEHQGGIGIQHALWGLNGTMDLFNVDGDDNIFIWGNGTVNLNQIRLEP